MSLKKPKTTEGKDCGTSGVSLPSFSLPAGSQYAKDCIPTLPEMDLPNPCEPKGSCGTTYWKDIIGIPPCIADCETLNDYIQDVIGDLLTGAITADNGLTMTAGNTQLGGPLLHDTLINAAGYNLLLGGSVLSPEDANKGYVNILNTQGYTTIAHGNIVAEEYSDLYLGLDGFKLMGKSGTFQTGFDFDINNNEGIIVHDNTDGIGLRYREDYRAGNIGFNYNPRWLIDIQFANDYYAPIDNSINYIQNQYISGQPADFWVSGRGQIQGPFTLPMLAANANSINKIGTDINGLVVIAPDNNRVPVTNKTGGTLLKGQVVYINGAQGSRATVALAIADSNVNTSLAVGIVEETILNNGNGYVITSGEMGGLDTSSFVNGDKVFLSPSIPGGLTTTIPTSPNNVVLIGTVTNSHSNQGEILVSILYTSKLDRLVDVHITSPVNNEVLTYIGGFWVNAPASGGVNPADVILNQTTLQSPANFNISGVGQASQFYAVGHASTPFKATWNTSNFAITDAGTAGEVYLSTVNTPTSANYNIRLNTGNTIINAPVASGAITFRFANTSKAQFMPTTGNFILQDAGTFTDMGYRLDVQGTTRVTGALSAETSVLVGTGVGNVWGDDNLVKPASTSAILNLKGGVGRAKIAISNDSVFIASGLSNIEFRGNASSSTNGGTTYAVQYPTTGNWVFQNGGTFVDNGYRVDVQGTARVSQTLTFNGAIVSGITGTFRDIAFQTSGVGRWIVRVNSAAETGANAGSNFDIVNRDDSGTTIGIPLSINRATGYVSIPNMAVAQTTDYIVTVDNAGTLRKNTSFTLSDIVASSRTLDINGHVQDLSANRTWRTAEADTGVITFAGLSTNTSNSINIGSARGYIVNNETNPLAPTYTLVTYAGEVNKIVTTVGSGLSTYVMLGVGGVISFQNTFPTSAERKTKIWLGKVGHPEGVITVVANEPDYITSPQAFSRDLFQALGPYINNGVHAYPNGANLSFNITLGSVKGNGINFVTDKTNPNSLVVGPYAPTVFLYRTSTGDGGAGVNLIEPGNMDVGGVITPVGGGANTSTVQYIFCIPDQGFIVQYGQVAYPTLLEAIASIGRESFTLFPSLANNAILIGVLAVNKNATNLSNTAQARFFNADKLGQIIGATSGVTTGTFQTVYNNSLQPQITTTTALGAVQYKRGSASDTDSVLQVLSGAGTLAVGMWGNGWLQANNFFSVGSKVASAGIAKANEFTNTLTATANNDVLVGLDIAPTFNVGAFTGVTSLATRLNGAIRVMRESSTGQYIDIQSTNVASSIRSYSTTGAAKELLLDSTTNALNDPPTVGAVGLAFAVLGNIKGRAYSTGNWVLQNGGIFTDAGYRLDVQGTSRHQGSVSATAGLAVGHLFNPTLTAVANGDVLVGLDIQPTFTVGAFTGVQQVAIRANGTILVGSGVGTAGGNDNLIRPAATSAFLNLKGGSGKGKIYIGNDSVELVAGTTGNGVTISGNATTTTAVGIRFLTMFPVTGNFVLQGGGGVTDAGYRLDVQGTTRITGALTLDTPLAVASGGTGLNAIGTALQMLRVNAGGTALEFATNSSKIKNSADVDQFSYIVENGFQITGGGDTTVSFDSGNRRVVITSIPGAGGGGAVSSFNGRTGGVVATEGDYALNLLGDVTIASPVNGQVLKFNGTTWVNQADAGSVVTPAAMTKVDDTNVTLTLGGTPATSLLQATSLTLGWTGTLADARIASAANWNTAYTNRITSLTTTGSSGAATLAANVLNIPNYTLVGLGGAPAAGSANYIQNQETAAQTAGAWVGGRLIVGNRSDYINSATTVKSIAAHNFSSGTANVISSIYGSVSATASGTLLGQGIDLYADVTLGTLRGLSINVNNTGSVSVPIMEGIAISGTIWNTSSTTDFKGINIRPFTQPVGSGGTLTNFYGLYIDTQIKADNNWGVYVQNAKNYFGGGVSIGGGLQTGFLLDVNGQAVVRNNIYISGDLIDFSANTGYRLVSGAGLTYLGRVGNVAIGTNVDNGYKLEVVGTARITGAVTMTSLPAGLGTDLMVTVDASGNLRKLAIPSGGGGATTLDGLTDVTITAPATNDLLQYNGSQWVNVTLATATGNAYVLKSGDTMTGTLFLPGFHANGTSTAAAGIVNANRINPTLVATAPGDMLVSLDIDPIYNVGGQTSYFKVPIRINTPSLSGYNTAMVLDYANWFTVGNTDGFPELRAFIMADNITAKFSHASTRAVRIQFRDGIRIYATPTASTGIGTTPTFVQYVQMYAATGNWSFRTSGSHSDAGYLMDIVGTVRFSTTVTHAATPTTSAGSYDFMSRNSSTGVVEKVVTVPVAKGGTGLTSLGTSLQVLRTNSAGTATEWATIAGGSTPTLDQVLTAGNESNTVSGRYAMIGRTTLGKSAGGHGLVGENVKTTTTSNQFRYWDANYAAALRFDTGSFNFYTAPVGVADAIITFTSRMFIRQTDGFVGIGNINPTATLDVTGTGKFSGALTLTTALATSSGGTGLSTIGTALQVLRVNAGGTALEWATPSGGGITGSGTADYISKWSAGTVQGNSVIYDNGTNVNIGGTTFTYASAGRRILGINGSTDSMIELQVAGVTNGYLFTTGSFTEIGALNKLQFVAGGALRATILNNGDTGIGAASPTAKLEVGGLSFNTKIGDQTTWDGVQQYPTIRGSAATVEFIMLHTPHIPYLVGALGSIVRHTTNFPATVIWDSGCHIVMGGADAWGVFRDGVGKFAVDTNGAYVQGNVVYHAANISTATVGASDFAYSLKHADGPRDLSNRPPNWRAQSVIFDFVNAATVSSTGNYGGVMTFSPWDGTSASTGDSSYQLGFINESGTNGSGVPGLILRKGIDTTWGSWYAIIHSGNIASQTVAQSNGLLYFPNRTDAAAYQILWGAGSGYTVAYSCAAVTITSSTGVVTATEFYRTSSRVGKENILPFTESALDIIMSTQICSYNKKLGNEKGIGFIAEDTHPYLSTITRKSHDFGGHLAILTKAMQEEDNKVKRLENRVKELEAKVASLERMQR